MANWFKRAMKTPETRLAVGALIPIIFLTLIGLASFMSPRVALVVLNFGMREVVVGHGDPVPMPADIAEGLLTGVPLSALKNDRAVAVLLDAVEDRGLKVRTRIACAVLAIRPALTESQTGRLKRALLEMGESHFSTHGMAIFTVLMGGTFDGDSEVRAFLINSANRDIAYAPYLARQKFPEAVPLIERALREGRWRGYSALGTIGGPEAFNSLVRLLQETTEPRWRFVILSAMGATKDPRARAVLLKHLPSKEREIYSGALRGLGYLGDPSTVAVLQKELKAKNIDSDRARKVARTLEAIKSGGEPFYH